MSGSADVKCAGCDSPVGPSSGRKPRKWCSETCRVRSYSASAARIAYLSAISEASGPRAYGVRRTADGRAADYAAKRRALERGAKVSRGRRVAVLERDGWICHLCNLPTNRHTRYPAWDSPVIDHVVPLARGGEHAPSNWATAHSHCNSLKRDLLMAEFVLAYPDLTTRVLALAA